MRKTLLFTLALLLSTVMFAQNRAGLIQESFNGSDFPAGWSIQGLGNGSWSISSTNNAGGTPNELYLYYNPSFNGISRIVMNPVDLTNVEEVVVSFRHYLDNYGGDSKIGIATSSDGGNTWNTGWQQTYNMTGGSVINQTISTSDMGKSSVLFCLFYEGNSYNINSWSFDDFEIFTQENLDVKLVSIDTPEIIPTGETEIVFTVQNVGKTIVNYFEATVNVTGWDEAVVATIDQTLAPFETRQIAFSYLSNATFMAQPQDEYYNIAVEINSVNGETDDDASNNTLEKDIFAAWGSSQRTTMIEHFTSSTCGPCVSVNYTMSQLTTNNPGKFTYTKYQMNWPGTGDPYYTEEGGTRRAYYACDAVPTVFYNGEYINTGMAQNMLDIENSLPAYANIRGAFNVEGNTINITADFMSYVKLEDVAAFITVNEKETTENVGSNGETSFNHVMMKMLDGANGNNISINPGEYQRLEFSFDMSSTNVEEMNDLEVALWLQNLGNKEVYNSKYAYEYTSHCYPAENLRETTSGKGTRTFAWDAPAQSTPTGYKVYVDGSLVEGNTSETSISYESSKQILMVEVIALYEGGKSSVGIVKKFDGNGVNVMENETASNLNIYPNPVKDVVRVSGEDINSISVYNSLGVLVEKIEVSSNNAEINMNDYNTGIYFIQVESNENVVSRKVVKL